MTPASIYWRGYAAGSVGSVGVLLFIANVYSGNQGAPVLLIPVIVGFTIMVDMRWISKHPRAGDGP